MKKSGFMPFTVAAVLSVLFFIQTAAAQGEFSTKIQELADKLTSTTSGKVIDVEGDIIYINLGEKDSVHQGAQFEVVKLGDVMMLDGKPYYKERPAGVIQITTVRKDFSLAHATAVYENIQKGDKIYQANHISPAVSPVRKIGTGGTNRVVQVSGVDVKSVFRRLENGGFSPGPYREDDLNSLSESVKKFQKFSKLPETGVLDAITWGKMKILYDPEASGESSPEAGTPSPPPTTAPVSGLKKVNKIALMEFPCGNAFNLFTKNVYESLSVHFVQKGFQVVERSQLEQVLEQQKMNHSGIIDISAAQKLGKLLGSEIVLLGSVSDMGNSLAVRARMVDVEKGLALTAAEVGFDKTPDILAMVGNVTIPGPRRTDPDKDDTSSPPPDKKWFYENDAVRIDVLSFTRKGDDLVLSLKFTNNTESDSFYMYLSDPEQRTYFVDSNGNRYNFKNSELKDSKVFPAGIPNAYTIIFRDIKNGSNRLTLSAHFSGGYGCPSFTAKIEDLTL